jgi:hypothetical protein
MGEVSKGLKMIKVTDAEKSIIYYIAPSHAKVIGIFKDMMDVAKGETGDPVYFLKGSWITSQIVMDETPDTLADLMAWLFRSPDFKVTDGSHLEVRS